MFKKNLIYTVFAVFSALILTGCENTYNIDDGRLSVVCTTFPCYDWTSRIIGDTQDISLTYLLSNGSDMHSFQPSVSDIAKISDCDVFVYIGGESDEWAEDVLENARNKDMKTVCLMDVLSDHVKEEEFKEGMEDSHGHDHDNDEHETEYDEHIWLSLNNAEHCVTAISDAMCAADSKNSAVYSENAASYTTQLWLLDRSFHLLFDTHPTTMIFGDRFPFRYFTDDYGLNYYSAFSGCSADTEASFETVTFLAKKADELDAKAIFTIENSDSDVAGAVIANTKSKSQKIAVLDSIQSVTQKQIDGGITYLSVMEKNYEVLKEVCESE